MWKKTFYLGAFLLICLLSCNSQTDSAAAFSTAEPLKIHRFDRALLQSLDRTDSLSSSDTLYLEYYPMLELTGKGILNVQSPGQKEFWPKLKAYYAEPTLRGLYQDAIDTFRQVSDIEQELGQAFAFLKAQFPSHTIPALYMHVSGFQQNILVADSTLSLSIDKYLGEDYPLYRQFFPDYERARMSRAFVSPDYLTGWLMSEFPFRGRENVLLDRMVYAGKLCYVLTRCLPDRSPAQLLGYDEEAARWCHDNEKMLWKTIISRKHLYTPDITTTQKYFEHRPCTFLSDHTPANIGTWIGLQIIQKYIQENPCSLAQLFAMEDAQAILTASRYKP